ncbi:hypothetical protein CQA49_04205 [Helicobacter sp. MIT 00-7814]|uniref:outer membrane protein n=1 Tax=unclassified Helicobacter TaxID=2593540 RepID=UPI000E1F017B|nr:MULTISPECIES: outer membrane protein [unclassified Helicobacter]RDU51937.1 hypothetical protein CQA37_09120 [Helicobacter sp. MIT 99-10781]RDU55038.1 hypothetical protein CQA49_04205 [Helicobacter sp. MIT 00-7814]
MKKSLFTSVILSALCASSAFAERGGGYIGVDIGHGNVKFDQYVNATTTIPAQPMFPAQNSVGHILADNSMANIAIKGGYKTFFGESKRFGVRGYVYFGYGYNSMKNISYTGDLYTLTGGGDSSIFTTTGKTYYNHVFDYGVGGDLLFNFIDAPEHSFGIYGGVAIGAETWVANGKEYKPNGGNGENYFAFQTTINAGIRGVFNEHHGIEFGVKFPLLDAEIFNGNGRSSLLSGPITIPGTPVPIPTETNLNSTTTTMKRPYIIHASYVYNF